ncbi:MAG: NADP-dependent isocitrate dehydrogenase [Opitutaceae bacterium]|jgi:isocitrate dehydrogenase|nr:NADP-dependent isocitrate dehydrogenase [Opitutaceae bacterium]
MSNTAANANANAATAATHTAATHTAATHTAATNAARPAIIYTKTDEAPALATYSLLPVIQAFTRHSGIKVETRDISLSGRILAAFADLLPENRRTADALAELGALTLRPEANIIKLPNISASLPQLKAAIAELQALGCALPDYPDAPATPAERDARARYDRVKGSAVNPVLRQGNSDRRAPKAVKAHARKHPHPMGAWSPDSKTRVVSMDRDDFFANEQSCTILAATTVKIVFFPAAAATATPAAPSAAPAPAAGSAPAGPPAAGTASAAGVPPAPVTLKTLPLLPGEILDATVLRQKALTTFIETQLARAKAEDLLFSVHLKATMMKVSDPVIFGHVVRAFFQKPLATHAATLARLGADPDNGLADILAKLQTLPPGERAPIEADLAAALAEGPPLAMVNSDQGITNLHVPSDTIVDASMPAMIRAGGKMWDAQGRPRDTLALIPDRTYAGVYQTVIDYCKQHGAFDPRTLGTVPNVGLMAQAAEEYGSHDKTFEIPADGVMRVIDTATGATLLEHPVERGDIWRACQTKDAAIRDWVRLALARARATGAPALFWLDPARAHDARLLEKLLPLLAAQDTAGLDLRVLPPAAACRATLERLAAGQDSISVTGNVLRDYLTDLFPILEVGTSAKMLSIVPLMHGGGLFETGAGGSAPKHVQQFLTENYLRWDSLGEFLALAASLEHYAATQASPPAKILADTLDAATARFLENNKSPGRKLGTIDNRGSHYYLALYWAQALAAQTQDPALAARFAPTAGKLAANETRITAELLAVQGRPVDIGPYYRPDDAKAAAAMRPSPTFNQILAGI